MTIVSSTLSGNSADQGGSVYSMGDGGTATVVVTNTILAGSGSGVYDFKDGTLNGGTSQVNGSGDLIQNTPTTAFSQSILGLAPLLGVLANNGGPTQTMALLSGSPALNAGNSAAAAGLLSDQRGFSSRTVGSGVDIGAFEVGAVANPVTVAITVPSPTYNADAPISVSVSAATGPLSGTVTLLVNGFSPLTQTLSGGSASFTLPQPSRGHLRRDRTLPGQREDAVSSLPMTVLPAPHGNLSRWCVAWQSRGRRSDGHLYCHGDDVWRRAVAWRRARSILSIPSPDPRWPVPHSTAAARRRLPPRPWRRGTTTFSEFEGSNNFVASSSPTALPFTINWVVTTTSAVNASVASPSTHTAWRPSRRRSRPRRPVPSLRRGQ